MKKNKFNNKGITLIELLIVLGIMGIILQVIYSIFFIGNKSFNIGKDGGFAQQDARIVSGSVTKELRTAKAITTVEGDLTGKYYSLGVREGKLIKETFDGGICSSNTLFSGSLSTLSFNHAEGNPNGIIKGKVIAKEGDQEVSFEFDILLENIPTYGILITDEEKIFYTKYE